MEYIKSTLILGLVLLLFNCSPKAITALSTEEYKEWDEKKKEMNPEEFKNMVEANESLTTTNQDLEEKEEYLQQSIENKDNEISRLNQQLAQVREEMNEAISKMEEKQTSDWNEGTVFRVQLAAFDDYDLRNLTENGSDMQIIDEEGYIKYVLGQFRDYDMADKFKKKLRKLGVKEAWIVPYKDGKRVPLKEVLSEVIE